MANRPLNLRPIATLIIGILLLIVAMPSNWKSDWAPGWLNPGFHLGLDLAGGTQLDFRISEEEIDSQIRSIDERIAKLEADEGSSEELNTLRMDRTIVEQQRQNLVEAIRTVLERRINSLGVSEATITPSYVGNEKHLLVECPGVVDVQQCIATVGKTIQLEFKEQFTEASAEFEAEVRAKAAAAMKRITGSGISLAVIGQDSGDDLGMGYQERNLFFKDQLPAGLEDVWDRTPQNGVWLKEGTIDAQVPNAQGEPVIEQIRGVFLVEVLAPRTQTGRLIQDAPTAFRLLSQTEQGASQSLKQDVKLEDPIPARTISALRMMKAGELKVVAMEDGSAQLLFLRRLIPGREEADVSHILVTYKGASNAAADVSRTKEQALARAQDLKKQLDGGASFEEIARTQSDGPSKQNAGKLGPIGRTDLVAPFAEVAFTQAEGVISDPVETTFGYHIIRVNKAPYKTQDVASYDTLTVTGENAETRTNDILARMQTGKITEQQEAIALRTLFYSLKPTGWKDTALDGKHFRSAIATLDPTTNLPLVQIIFDAEGGKIFQELTKTNIGKSIAIFVGGEMVSAPTVQGEISGGTAVITGSQNFEEARLLAQDLNTGAIPAPIYLSGQRTVEASLGEEALQMSVYAGLIGMIIVMLYMLFMYRFLGLIANVALAIYALLFLAILKLPLFLITDQYIVLTLAGAAGTILSIGMAVDTNVLVFERVKEELRKGKSLKSAVEIGFDKAWSSIRDSNISTIITCVLLFMIGTSIVRGFAVTLGMGVLVSMFTGMIITRWMARKVAVSPIAEKTHLFPGAKNVVN